MDDCPLIMVSSDLDISFVGAVCSRRDDVSAPTQTAVIGGRRPADPFGADLWVAMPALPRLMRRSWVAGTGPAMTVLSGWVRRRPAGSRRCRRIEKIPTETRRKSGRFTVITVAPRTAELFPRICNSGAD
jgi:hypothetical protein